MFPDTRELKRAWEPDDVFNQNFDVTLQPTQTDTAVRIRRIVPDFESSDLAEFYSGLLGLVLVMDHGWIVTLADPNDPARQLSVASHDESASVVTS